jgi:hypothetical protein
MKREGGRCDCPEPGWVVGRPAGEGPSASLRMTVGKMAVFGTTNVGAYGNTPTA